jgi:hypothetical protein
MTMLRAAPTSCKASAIIPTLRSVCLRAFCGSGFKSRNPIISTFLLIPNNLHPRFLNSFTMEEALRRNNFATLFFFLSFALATSPRPRRQAKRAQHSVTFPNFRK